MGAPNDPKKALLSKIDLSIKVSNYKCFGAESQGFEQILPINLIIGRNNAGKSALLDLIEHAIEPRQLDDHAHPGGGIPRVLLRKPLEEDELRRVFPETRSGGAITGNHWEYGERLIGSRLTWQLTADTSNMRGAKNAFVDMHKDPASTDIQPFQIPADFRNSLAQAVENPLKGRFIFRLRADRDIVPEKAIPNLFLEGDGSGATSIIEGFLHAKDRSSTVVEEALLGDLNKIFLADTVEFSRIIAKEDRMHNLWEIYLEENNKGQIPLAHSGSGLKTILLVLCCVHLLPLITNVRLGKYIFLFEELENNLHPSLQRRLAFYLRTLAEQTGAIFFLTTHSSTTIDFFSADPAAQIIHVIHDGRSATAATISTYIERRGILDDLDIRASDLLQANCVVWVEGPTDRLYFNRWIQLWADEKLREGVHYQCVFYGGRLLAHLDGRAPDSDQDHGVHILSVNRHTIIIIDSDRRSSGQDLNTTKKRLIKEVSDVEGIAWLTAGREIENYVPVQAIEICFSQNGLAAMGEYQFIGDYVAPFAPKYGADKFNHQKVPFAEQVCPEITREGLATTLDLSARLDEVVAYIKKCNGIT